MPTPNSRRPSFHRRILPWIYIIAFFAIAPAVIFYTAGYRYNTKKGKVERFSTLIVDSTPTGATVTLDGQAAKDVTPLTIQTVPPGIHRVSISKDGYSGWEKSLELDAERATFASDVWLWRTAEPSLRFPQAVQALTSSPDAASVIRVTSTTGTTSFAVTDPIGSSQFTLTAPAPLSPPFRWSWSSDEKRVLLESGTSTWVLDLQTRQAPIQLPQGTYRWSQNAITGTDGIRQITMTLPQYALSQQSLKNQSYDATETGDMIRSATSTPYRVFVSHASPNEGLVLPSGAWTFWRSAAETTLFRDGARWLAVQPKLNPPQSHAANGVILEPIPGQSTAPYLLVNNGELWTWEPTEDPELMYRQSDPIIAAHWHRAGHDVFFVTSKTVYALNLDPRDGRIQTTLATFDAIIDMTVAGKELFIAGTKNNQTGVWALKVE